MRLARASKRVGRLKAGLPAAGKEPRRANRASFRVTPWCEAPRPASSEQPFISSRACSLSASALVAKTLHVAKRVVGFLREQELVALR